MIEYSDEIGEGYIISLADLRRRLAAISKGAHQWMVEPFCEGELQSHVLIGYTNPVMADMPNSLYFLFPIAVHAESARSEDRTFVCLHPTVANAASHGLYFERDELKQDLIEDWILFWSPLRKSLIADSSNMLVANRLSLHVNGQEYKRVIFRFSLEWGSLGSSPDVVIADEPGVCFALKDHFVIELKEDGRDWRKVSRRSPPQAPIHEVGDPTPRGPTQPAHQISTRKNPWPLKRRCTLPPPSSTVTPHSLRTNVQKMEGSVVKSMGI